MRLVKVLVALPMILLFGILRLFATALSWLYCRAASLLFIPMIILLILSVIATQWLAVGIIGVTKGVDYDPKKMVSDIKRPAVYLQAA